MGYASLDWMRQILGGLGAVGIARTSVRLLSAHYTRIPHICGPRSCGEISVDMDGTQWTDLFPGVGGLIIDMSELRDDFFAAAIPTWQEAMMQQLPILEEGAAGSAVRTVQGLCDARGWPVKVDGIFGPDTGNAVRLVQGHAGITIDGVVGPQTWPALLGIA